VQRVQRGRLTKSMVNGTEQMRLVVMLVKGKMLSLVVRVG
jgi:hypothetical protein